MAKAEPGFEAVRRAARGLPGVEEGTCFGKPALRIGGKMFACMASHRSAEPGTLVARTALERRKELLAEAPDVFYLTDHYVGYSAVLARLAKIPPDALRGLLIGAMRFVQALPRK